MSRAPQLLTAAVAGALFGVGLYVSQMVDPLKVLRFLDFTAIPSGGWDPSLAFVIVPAILVMFVAVRIGRSRQAPFLDTSFHEPDRSRIDSPLIGGAALFGLGWGMTGLCPGPALALLAFGPANLLYFLVALAVGSYLTRFLTERPAAAGLVPQ
jgi:uncharacterized membrane protein YedE/YeeE